MATPDIASSNRQQAKRMLSRVSNGDGGRALRIKGLVYAPAVILTLIASAAIAGLVAGLPLGIFAGLLGFVAFFASAFLIGKPLLSKAMPLVEMMVYTRMLNRRSK